MKRFFTFLTTTFLLCSFTVFSSIDEVVTALKTGNTNQVAKFFDSTVEITMPDKSNSYSKARRSWC